VRNADTKSAGKKAKKAADDDDEGSYSYSYSGSPYYTNEYYSDDYYSYSGDYYYSDYYYSYSSVLPPIVLVAKKTTSTRKDLKTGKYLRLIDDDPCALTFCDFALYLTSENDPDRAERYFRRALTAEPNDVRTLASYALFLEQVRHNFERAGALYAGAVQVSRRKRKHASLYNNYAVFLKNIKSDFQAAEIFYKKAIKLAPEHCNALGNYGLFHKKVTRDYERALFYMERAVEVADFPEDKEIWRRRHDRLILELKGAQRRR
jgi:tetratricopeptide (TPR) repeat protein